ncbi:MAG: transcriptional regulator [Salaquimonas sp.]|jgi:transcriptional regulator with XRE-family HTH domain|nr:transcriptional regulator [Salaquimonas sp.]
MLDKREIVAQFRERLEQLIERRGENLSAFARRCHMDRSALSQFLDAKVSRLPRAETLCTIAAAEAVSVDWLLGLSQSERSLGEVARVVSIETAEDGIAESRLAEWHREAIGYKIRYVPATLPDLLRTQAVLNYEFRSEQPALRDAKTGQARQQLDYSRRPETDMEIVMPYQRLYELASGAGIWSDLPRGARAAQIEHMAQLLEELYPTLRLFLYDGIKAYSAPFTVFGPKRAAIYIGEMYLVVNAVEHIRALTARFDHLIRIASISADRAPAFINQLKVT